MSQIKRRIAVFFGGRSPEHDVSVITGLQILGALDRHKYDAFPVYITPDGVWLTGDVLLKRENYLLDKNNRKQATEVTLDVTANRIGRLLPKKSGFLSKGKPIEFDVALPSFHGLYGEDGEVQGLFEFAGVPYAGMRTMASAIFMDKAATKMFLQSLGIPVLPCVVVRRQFESLMLNRTDLQKLMGTMPYPVIVKPSHLGSSIGVAKAENIEEVQACLPAIFEYDDTAIIEPFVPNMVEYNVAVTRIKGEIRTSAIERPKTKEALLDFKSKYLAGGGSKSGTKTPGQGSEGMLSLTRELNPRLSDEFEGNIRKWVAKMFFAIDGTGAPRIDFISDGKSGHLWLNEVNPWPGSLGYFLWEAAEKPFLFSELLDNLIEEALTRRRGRALPADPVPVDARLLKRPMN